MALTDELKILDDNMIKTEKQLKYLHYHQQNWISMNI